MTGWRGGNRDDKKIEWAFLCQRIEQTLDGTINAFGINNEIVVKELPCDLTLTFVYLLRADKGEAGQYRRSVIFSGPKGAQARDPIVDDVTISTPSRGLQYSMSTSYLQFRITISNPGTHALHCSFNDMSTYSLTFIVFRLE